MIFSRYFQGFFIFEVAHLPTKIKTHENFRLYGTTAFGTSVVDHWLEKETAMSHSTVQKEYRGHLLKNSTDLTTNHEALTGTATNQHCHTQFVKLTKTPRLHKC